MMEEPELKLAVAARDVAEEGTPIGKARLAQPVLDQNEYWWTADGRSIKLEEMSPSHRVNLIHQLESHPHRLLINYQIEQATSPMWPRDHTYAADDFERILEEEYEKWHDRPLEWLQQTPFYLRLRWLIEQDRANGEPF